MDTHRAEHVTHDGNLYRTALWIGCCAAMLTSMLLALVVFSGTPAAAASSQQGPPPDENRREVSVTARRNGFSPARLEVHQNDLVKVTFTAEDAPHSFNVDAYRIAKRARPGHPAVFEFRADRAGTFTYYCNLSSTTGTHDMKGELIVLDH